jgi:pheromone a factor receptor
MYMIWTALGCLTYCVDSIVWSGNTINWAPVWCDIGTFTNIFHSILITHELCSVVRIQIALAVAWPACILCIIRRLYHIACPSTVSTTRTDVRCRIVLGFANIHLTSFTETP